MAKKPELFNSKKKMMKACSQPDDWQMFKDMLLNLRLAVAVYPRPDAAVRHLARTWYSDGKYRSPICDSTLLKLTALKKANLTLEEMIDLYIDLEEGTENDQSN